MYRSDNLLSFIVSVILCGFLLSAGGCGGSGGTAAVPPAFVALGADGNVLTSTDSINWQIRPSGVGPLLSIVHGKDTFVAWYTTRSLSVNIFSSSDVVTWTPRSVGEFPAIAAATYANNMFVAVSSLFGYVLTSPDGVNWTHAATLTNPTLGYVTLHAVTYGNGKFVTVGDNGIYYSADGLHWIAASSASLFLRAVAYGNGVFVAAGDGGGKYFVSSDGVNWTEKPVDSFGPFPISSIAYGNNLFVAVGGNVIFTSPDGLNWAGSPNSVAPGVRVSFANGVFFLTGTNGTILTSPDGIHWTQRTSGTTEDISTVTSG